jgi:hypothetical protein
MSRTRGASHGTHHRKLDMRTEHSVRDRCSRLGTGKYLRRMRGRSNRLARRGTLGQSAPDVVAIMPIRTDCIREQQRPAEKCVFSVRPESVRRRREPLWANGSPVGSSSTSPRPAVRESRGLTPGNPDERAPVCLSHRPGRITQGEPEPIYLSAVTGLDHSRGVRVAFGLSLVIFTSASDLGFGWWLWSRAWPRRPASTSNDTRRVESNLVRPGASRRAPHSEPSAASDRRTRSWRAARALR